jgi:hypothetical protein
MKPSRLTTVLAGACLLAACAKSMTRPAPATAAEQEANAEAKLCKSMTTREPAITEFPQVTQETPLDSVKKANARLEQAVQDVTQSSGQINKPEILDVAEKFRLLQNTVNTVPGGRETVGPAADSIGMEADQLRESWNRLYSSMQCGA